MYTYYVLRGTQESKPVELEGEIDEEHFPDVDLGDGREILAFLVQVVDREAGVAGAWEEAELTDSLFDGFFICYAVYEHNWMRCRSTSRTYLLLSYKKEERST